MSERGEGRQRRQVATGVFGISFRVDFRRYPLATVVLALVRSSRRVTVVAIRVVGLLGRPCGIVSMIMESMLFMFMPRVRVSNFRTTSGRVFANGWHGVERATAEYAVSEDEQPGDENDDLLHGIPGLGSVSRS